MTHQSGGHFTTGEEWAEVALGMVPKPPIGPLHLASRELGSLFQKSGVGAPEAQERHRGERSQGAAPGVQSGPLLSLLGGFVTLVLMWAVVIVQSLTSSGV